MRKSAILISKFETIPNQPKLETNSKIEFSDFISLDFDPLNLFRISIFGFPLKWILFTSLRGAVLRLRFSALSNGFEKVGKKDQQSGRDQYRGYLGGGKEKTHEYKGKKNAEKGSSN